MTGTVSETTESLRSRVPGPVVWFVSPTLRRQTYRNLAYLLLAYPLGIVYLVFLSVAVPLGIGLSILLVGLVILGVTLLLGLAIASFERWLTARMLGIEIEPRIDLPGETTPERFVTLLTQRETWTAIAYLPTKFVLGTVSFVVVVTTTTTGLSMLQLPLYYDRPGLYVGLVPDRAPEFHQSVYLGWNYLLVGIEAVVTVGSWRIETLSGALLAAVVGVLGLVLTLHLVNAMASLWGRYTRFMLEDCYDVLLVAFGE